MCWSTQQAIDLAIEYGLPCEELDIEALTVHIPGGLLDLGPEDFERSKEFVSFLYWYYMIVEKAQRR